MDEKEKSLLPPLSGTLAERQAKFNEKSKFYRAIVFFSNLCPVLIVSDCHVMYSVVYDRLQ